MGSRFCGLWSIMAFVIFLAMAPLGCGDDSTGGGEDIQGEGGDGGEDIVLADLMGVDVPPKTDLVPLPDGADDLSPPKDLAEPADDLPDDDILNEQDASGDDILADGGDAQEADLSEDIFVLPDGKPGKDSGPQPDLVEPPTDVEQTDVAQQDVEQTDVDQQDLEQTDVAQQDVEQTDVAQQDLQADAEEPDLAQQDALTPDATPLEDMGGVTEVCDDRRDNDSDGLADCLDPDCFDDPSCTSGSNDTCPYAVDVSAGGTFEGNTTGLNDNVRAGCRDSDGRDAVFTLTIGEESMVDLIVNATFDVVLFVRAECEDPASEMACHDPNGRVAAVSLPHLGPGTYSIFVDGRRGLDRGDFTLTVDILTLEPEICDDDLDNDGDGMADCGDPDCLTFPGCEDFEICDDHEDNDHDGLVDCFDPYCFEEEVCQFDEICDNGVDDDGDNLTDCIDPDCNYSQICNGGDNDVCPNALPVEAGVYTGTTTGMTNNTRPTCGTGAGPDVFFRLDLLETADVVLDASGTSFDSVLAIRTACDDPSSEIACDDDAGAGNTSMIERMGMAPGTYFIILDGYQNASHGSYTLSVSIRIDVPEICDNGVDDNGNGMVDCADRSECCQDPACEDTPECQINNICASAMVIGPGQYTGSTVGMGNDYRASCGNSAQSPEVVFQIDLPTPSNLIVDASGSTFDTVLHIRSDCESEASEVDCDDDDGDGNTSRISLLNQEAGTYYIFMDGYGTSAQGNFVLTVEAVFLEDCTNGVDDNQDGLVDCDDPVCLGNPVCPEICDDGLDNDGDRQTDCDDDDCLGNPICPEICDDELDNDGDGHVDCSDGDCITFHGCITEICDDEIDNDGDELTDCRDEECFDEIICQPEVCDDHEDNNANGLIDCADPMCFLFIDCLETEDCSDGRDNDGDGLIDCDDEDCLFDPVACPGGEDCSDLWDNDGDGLWDCLDPDCFDDALCSNVPGDTCLDPLTLTEGITSGDTQSAVDNFRSTGCGAAMAVGGDLAYTITLDDYSWVWIDTLDSAFDTVLMVRANCVDPNTELYCNDDIAVGVLQSGLLADLAPGEYTIIVDSWSPVAAGEFNLNVEILERGQEVCLDGEDNDGNGQIDCEDSACYSHPACQMGEICGNYWDDDRDGLTDCEDDDCLGHPTCLGYEVCDDGMDNDGDDLADCTDLDCMGDPLCTAGQNDVCEGAEELTEGTITGSTLGFHDNFHPLCADGTGPDRVYSLTLNEPSQVIIDTNGSAFDTVLSLMGECGVVESSLACNDDGEMGLVTSLLDEVLEAGQYTLVLDGFDESALGDFVLNVTILPAR